MELLLVVSGTLIRPCSSKMTLSVKLTKLCWTKLLTWYIHLIHGYICFQVEDLLENPAYRIFTWIGSGLQKHYGHITIAQQDVNNSIPKRESAELWVFSILSQFCVDTNRLSTLWTSSTQLDLSSLFATMNTTSKFIPRQNYPAAFSTRATVCDWLRGKWAWNFKTVSLPIFTTNNF